MGREAERARARKGGVRVRPPPKGVEQVPWEAVQAAFGVEGACVVASLVRLGMGAVQDEIRRQGVGTIGESDRLRARGVQDEMQPQVAKETGESNRVRDGSAQDEIGRGIVGCQSEGAPQEGRGAGAALAVPAPCPEGG